MDQEFAETVRQVFDVQRYPDIRESPDGPLEQPYDAAGWTLPMQMGVTVVALDQPIPAALRSAWRRLGSDLAPTAAVTPYDTGTADAAPFDSAPGIGFNTDSTAAAIVPPEGRVTGSGPALSLDPAQNNTFKALNRAWTMKGAVAFHGGRYVVTGLAAAQHDELVRMFSLYAERLAVPSGLRPLTRPRVGLYRPWIASMDEGWTRWVLEQYGFDVVSLYPRDFRDARLADRVDALIIADEARNVLTGYGAGVVPSQYEGGIGDDGVRAIDAFVRGGGTLVCFNRGTAFAIEQFGLPVRNVVAGLKREEFFTGGSLLQVEMSIDHPVMSGMPRRAAIFVEGSPAFETGETFTGHVLARYQASGSPLLSGYLVGDRFLHGRAAAVDVPHGDGHIVLLGFRPQWRGQPFGTFRVIFNAVTALGRAAH
jgi:hypothetical protein